MYGVRRYESVRVYHGELGNASRVRIEAGSITHRINACINQAARSRSWAGEMAEA
jgi:hypothetical protein